MENERSHQSVVNFAFVVLAALVAFVVGTLFETLAETFGPVARFRNIELAKQGIPVAAGLITFIAMAANPKVRQFGDDVITEIGKVVWPSRKDVTTMTIVCCGMCVLAGVGFGIFDFFASQLIQVFVH